MKLNWRLHIILSLSIALVSLGVMSAVNNEQVRVVASILLFAAPLFTLFIQQKMGITQTGGEETAADNASAVDKKHRSRSQDAVATLYIGNLPYKANEEAVKEFCQAFVDVVSVRLMKDKRTGKRKGYGFIEVNCNNLDTAIAALNEKQFHDRTIKVRSAKDKPE